MCILLLYYYKVYLARGVPIQWNALQYSFVAGSALCRITGCVIFGKHHQYLFNRTEPVHSATFLNGDQDVFLPGLFPCRTNVPFSQTTNRLHQPFSAVLLSISWRPCCVATHASPCSLMRRTAFSIKEGSCHKIFFVSSN